MILICPPADSLIGVIEIHVSTLSRSSPSRLKKGIKIQCEIEQKTFNRWLTKVKKTTSEKALRKRTENDAKTPSKGINEWVKNVLTTTPEKTSKKHAEHDHLGIHFGLLFVGNLDTNLVNLDDNLVNLERVSRLTKLPPKLTKFETKLAPKMEQNG